jgi:hypothetical protein
MRTGFRFDAGNVFGQHGIFIEPGLIVNVAQTAAARTGWLAFQKASAEGHGFQSGSLETLSAFP